MRKAFLTVLMCITMTGGVLAGCGRKAVQQAAEEPQITPDPHWQDTHTIDITPQGDFVFTTALSDGTEIEVPANVTIEETTDGCENGYKKVICHLAMDFADHKGFIFNSGTFDRSTGISLDYSPDTAFVGSGESSSAESSMTLAWDGVSYAFTLTTDDVRDDNGHWDRDTILTCPTDYDGAVFYVGYCSEELAFDIEEIGLHPRLYTLDELPEYQSGKPYYYFTYTNQ